MCLKWYCAKHEAMSSTPLLPKNKLSKFRNNLVFRLLFLLCNLKADFGYFNNQIEFLPPLFPSAMTLCLLKA
jgi:hypothetical protein